MSLGANSSSNKSQAQQTATSSSQYDPTQTNMINDFARTTADSAKPGGTLAYTPYTGPGLTFGDQTPLQNLTAYQAPQATATGYTASTIDPNSVPNVTAGQIATTNLQPYENPYASDVINTTSAQLARQNQIDNTTAAGEATAAGAFGGSRSAVLQNLNTDSYQRNLDQTVAGLNAQNFAQAQGAAGQDIASKLQADQGNQAAGLTIGQANTGAQNTASATNAAATNTASLANQQADIQAAQTKLAAYNITAQQAQAIFGANWAQYLNSQQDPQAVQALINNAMGLVPTSPLSTSSSQGTSSGSGSSFGFSASAPK